jgi:TrfA protein.
MTKHSSDSPLTDSKETVTKDSALSILNNRKLILEEEKRKNYLVHRGINPNKEFVIQDLFPDTLFKNGYRVIPNDIARGALFTTRSTRVERRTFTRHSLFHLSSDVSLLYTGQELYARDDELIWLQLVHYCIGVQLGDPVTFSITQLVKDIGWSTSGQSYRKVRESFSRLAATEIYIENKTTYGVSGGFSLIDKYIGINDGNRMPSKYQISIDRNIIFLLAGNTFTNIPWEKYKKLSPMCRRLADYTFSHKYPNPLRISQFLQLCDSQQIDSPKYVQNLTVKRLLEELVKQQIVKKAYIYKGKIHLER